VRISEFISRLCARRVYLGRTMTKAVEKSALGHDCTWSPSLHSVSMHGSEDVVMRRDCWIATVSRCQKRSDRCALEPTCVGQGIVCGGILMSTIDFAIGTDVDDHGNPIGTIAYPVFIELRWQNGGTSLVATDEVRASPELQARVIDRRGFRALMKQLKRHGL
jgi:hypothetical protein